MISDRVITVITESITHIYFFISRQGMERQRHTVQAAVRSTYINIRRIIKWDLNIRMI